MKKFIKKLLIALGIIVSPIVLLLIFAIVSSLVVNTLLHAGIEDHHIEVNNIKLEAPVTNEKEAYDVAYNYIKEIDDKFDVVSVQRIYNKEDILDKTPTYLVYCWYCKSYDWMKPIALFVDETCMDGKAHFEIVGDEIKSVKTFYAPRLDFYDSVCQIPEEVLTDDDVIMAMDAFSEIFDWRKSDNYVLNIYASDDYDFIIRTPQNDNQHFFTYDAKSNEIVKVVE